MNKRYEVEHNLIYKQFDDDPIMFIDRLKDNAQNILKEIFEKNELKYDLSDFNYGEEVYRGFNWITLSLPTNELEYDNCYSIIISYVLDLNLFEYFVIEKKKNQTSDYKQLTSIMENSIVDVSTVDDLTKNQIFDKIISYMSL